MDGNEKYIVESLKNHHEEIDMDGLWADVAPQIPREKKEKENGFLDFWVIDDCNDVGGYWLGENYLF